MRWHSQGPERSACALSGLSMPWAWQGGDTTVLWWYPALTLPVGLSHPCPQLSLVPCQSRSTNPNMARPVLASGQGTGHSHLRLCVCVCIYDTPWRWLRAVTSHFAHGVLTSGMLPPRSPALLAPPLSSSHLELSLGQKRTAKRLTSPEAHPSPLTPRSLPLGLFSEAHLRSGPAGGSYWDFMHIPGGRGTISLLRTLLAGTRPPALSEEGG